MISKAPSTLSSMILTPFLGAGNMFPTLKYSGSSTQPVSHPYYLFFKLSDIVFQCQPEMLDQATVGLSGTTELFLPHVRMSHRTCSTITLLGGRSFPGGSPLCWPAGTTARRQEEWRLYCLPPHPTNIIATAMWILGCRRVQGMMPISVRTMF